jgi:hypothetical protein
MRIRSDAAEVDAPARELDENSTYSRRNQTVSTVRKSQAIIADACARRNSDQLIAARRGAGSTPCRRRIAHTVVGAT